MNELLDELIYQNIRMEIKTSGKTKKEIAAAIGVNPKAVSDYFTGKTLPPLPMLSKLCNYLDCSADDILLIKPKY